MVGVLITGATGFVGKVVLAYLMQELPGGVFYVLVRAKRGVSMKERCELLLASEAFASIDRENTLSRVIFIEGDMTKVGIGVSEEDIERLQSIEQVVHCAASISFDSPVVEALRINTTATMDLVSLVRNFPRFRRFVYVSTCYVHASTKYTETNYTGELREALREIDRPAHEFLDMVHSDPDGLVKEMNRLRFPNSYTFSKCMTEHKLVEAFAETPGCLSIVRPAVVGGAERFPRPGWVDSLAAFTGFLALGASGYYRCATVAEQVHLEITPVDWVAFEIYRQLTIDATQSEESVRIVQVVANNSNMSLGCICRLINSWGGELTIVKNPKWRDAMHRLYNTYPLIVAQGACKVSGSHRLEKKVESIKNALDNTHTSFGNFTRTQYNFVSPYKHDRVFDSATWHHTYYREVYSRYVHPKQKIGAFSTFVNPNGGWDSVRCWWRPGRRMIGVMTRVFAFFLTKVFRRIFTDIEVDVDSFLTAKLQRGCSPVVMLPNHQSYFDFLIIPYMCFKMPELDIPMPRIAASAMFKKVAIVGKMMPWFGAYYVDKNASAEQRRVLQKDVDMSVEHGSMLVFLEGTRSRSRHMSKPLTGILRCCGKCENVPRIQLLPISISYETIAEYNAFSREMCGANGKPKMHISAMLVWLWQMIMGRVRLGKVVVRAGKPMSMLCAGTRVIKDVATRPEDVATRPEDIATLSVELAGRIQDCLSPMTAEKIDYDSDPARWWCSVQYGWKGCLIILSKRSPEDAWLSWLVDHTTFGSGKTKEVVLGAAVDIVGIRLAEVFKACEERVADTVASKPRSLNRQKTIHIPKFLSEQYAEMMKGIEKVRSTM